MFKNIIIGLLILLNIHLAFEATKYVNKSKKLEQESFNATYHTDSEVDTLDEFTPTVYYEKIQDTLGNIHIDTVYRYIVLRSVDGEHRESDVYSVVTPTRAYDYISSSEVASILHIPEIHDYQLKTYLTGYQLYCSDRFIDSFTWNEKRKLDQLIIADNL